MRPPLYSQGALEIGVSCYAYDVAVAVPISLSGPSVRLGMVYAYLGQLNSGGRQPHQRFESKQIDSRASRQSVSIESPSSPSKGVSTAGPGKGALVLKRSRDRGIKQGRPIFPTRLNVPFTTGHMTTTEPVSATFFDLSASLSHGSRGP